jgi:hypothetical protein
MASGFVTINDSDFGEINKSKKRSFLKAVCSAILVALLRLKQSALRSRTLLTVFILIMFGILVVYIHAREGAPLSANVEWPPAKYSAALCKSLVDMAKAPASDQLLCLSSDEVICKASLLMKHLAARRAASICTGPDHGIVCDETRFWDPPLVPAPTHLSLSHNAVAEAADTSAATPMTPWLRVGPLKFASNEYIDWIVFSIFFSQHSWLGRGTFLESGASNGVHASNTIFFERSLNWTGVLIESTPCAVCVLPKNRRGSTIMHAALGVPGGPNTFSFREFEFCSGGQDSCMPRPWPPVRAAPLQELMAEVGYKNVDLFVLDVEEFSETVLENIVWGVFSPKVIVVECRKEDLCVSILTRAGYTIALPGTALKQDLLAWKNSCTA